MKKILRIIALSLAVAMLVGCTQTGKESLEVVTDNTVAPEKAANTDEVVPEVNVSTETKEPTTEVIVKEPNSTIETEVSENEAKLIALKHAGLAEKDVTFVKVKTDTDDGEKVYDIEFVKGNEEYDYEIRVSDGKILDVDKDIEGYVVKSNDSTKTTESRNDTNTRTEAKVSESEAEKIALNHAKLNANDVRMKKTELDSDDGVLHYEIEFETSLKEYSYDIDANSGKILEVEVDNLDD